MDNVDRKKQPSLKELIENADDSDISYEEWYKLPIFNKKVSPSPEDVNVDKIKRTERRFCGSCGEDCGSRELLRLHRWKCTKRITCKRCNKKYASHQSLSNHRKICSARESMLSRRCGVDDPIKSKLEWNGKYWKTRNTNLHYQINLGRDLSSLLEREAIKEDALNDMQRESIIMYNALFQNIKY